MSNMIMVIQISTKKPEMLLNRQVFIIMLNMSKDERCRNLTKGSQRTPIHLGLGSGDILNKKLCDFYLKTPTSSRLSVFGSSSPLNV